MATPVPGTFDNQQGDSVTAGKSGNRRPMILVVVAVVVALALGGGAWALSRAMGGSGDQPANALPATSAAYVRMDIDPSVGQKIAAVRFLEGLDDEAMDELRDGDLRRAAFEALAEEDEAFAAIDYDTDIEPWLGDRLGMAVIPQGEDMPMAALAVQVKDQDAAEEGLSTLRDTAGGSSDDAEAVGWFFEGDYAVITSQEWVEQIQSDVEGGTLADDETFSSDMAALDGEGVLSGWVDAPKIAEAATSDAMTGEMDAGDMSGDMAGMGDLDLSAAQGRFAAAVRFDPDFIEVAGVTRGAEAYGFATEDSPGLVRRLPSDTVAAVGLEHGASYVKATWDQLEKQMPEETQQFADEAAAAGFTLPDDLQTLLGESMTMSAGATVVDDAVGQRFDSLPIAFRVSTDDPGMLQAQSEALSSELGATGMLVHRTDDDVFTLGMSQDYVDEVAKDGGLADDETFLSVVPDPESADALLYVNLDPIEEYYLPQVPDADARDSLEKISAVGASGRSDEDGNGQFTFRVAAGE